MGVGLGSEGGGLGPGGDPGTTVGGTGVLVATGEKRTQICWPTLSRVLSRQFTSCSCCTVVLVAWPMADSESLAWMAYSTQPNGGEGTQLATCVGSLVGVAKGWGGAVLGGSGSVVAVGGKAVCVVGWVVCGGGVMVG